MKKTSKVMKKSCHHYLMFRFTKSLQKIKLPTDDIPVRSSANFSRSYGNFCFFDLGLSFICHREDLEDSLLIIFHSDKKLKLILQNVFSQTRQVITWREKKRIILLKMNLFEVLGFWYYFQTFH